jgi:hypothetical protein
MLVPVLPIEVEDCLGFGASKDNVMSGGQTRGVILGVSR